MIEKKFRFWDIEGDQMWTQDEIIDFQRGEEDAAYNIFYHMLGADHWIPLQYIGLKDKNGKEIYEGDILKHQYSIIEQPPYSYSIHVVEFGDYDNGESYEDAVSGYGYYLLGKGRWNGEISSIDFYRLDELEVIGNIYENKELL